MHLPSCDVGNVDADAAKHLGRSVGVRSCRTILPAPAVHWFGSLDRRSQSAIPAGSSSRCPRSTCPTIPARSSATRTNHRKRQSSPRHKSPAITRTRHWYLVALELGRPLRGFDDGADALGEERYAARLVDKFDGVTIEGGMRGGMRGAGGENHDQRQDACAAQP